MYEYETMVDVLLTAARAAGKEILKVYSGHFDVELKDDNTPVTKADKLSQGIILAELKRHFSDIPAIAEEGRILPYSQRKDWPRFFLVDPLDGTKEFVKKNGEFTVNIAMVARDFPAFGVIYVPAYDAIYWGGKDFGSFKQVSGGDIQRLSTAKRGPDEALRVVGSRSHPSEEFEQFLETVNVAERMSVGSSLKFCLVAEGRADLYQRFNMTKEWDTAAGQAIVEGAGGSMTTLDGAPFTYNKKDLTNPGFICRG